MKMLERISLSIGYKCRSCVLYLCDSRVGTFAVNAVVLQPLVLWVRAVLLEGAAVLPFTPNAPKERVGLQTQTTASTLGIALVQVHWEKRGASMVFISVLLYKRQTASGIRLKITSSKRRHFPNIHILNIQQ